MTDMIERVAKAMAENDSGPMDSALFAIHWREFGEGYIDSARVAIAAMREPTTKMVDQCMDTGHMRGDAEAVWEKMTDAALECSTKQTEK